MHAMSVSEMRLTISAVLVAAALAGKSHKKCRRVSNSPDPDDPSTEEPEVIKSPLPHTYIPYASLPTEFDWRNVNGVNYVTVDLNQQYVLYPSLHYHVTH